MNKKAIQEQRKRSYFIEAASEIIHTEGVANLTVKKVADRAGYSAGTLYNYFTDLKSLLSYCAVEFWTECERVVLEAGNGSANLQEKIIAYAKGYCQYFIDHPNVFQIIFLEELGSIPEEIEEQVVYPQVVKKLRMSLIEGVEEGLFAEENVAMIENLLANSLHGILLFYVKKRSNMTKEGILKLIEEEVKYLIKTDKSSNL